MLTAVEETSLWTTGKIRAIRALMDTSVGYVSRSSPKIYSRELVEVVFTQPYCRIGNVMEAISATRQTASKHLKELRSIGVLEERKEGREILYLNTRLLTLLTTDENQFKPFG